jgi:cell division septum initiation protein DivIVA
VRRGGYDPQQVHEYLDKLADWIEWFRSELAATRSRLERTEEELQAIGPDPEGNAYIQLGHRVADLLRVADEHAEKIRVEAQQIADKEIEGARESARKLLSDAEAEAARVRDQDRMGRASIHEEANALLAAGDELRANLESMHQRISRFTDDVADPPRQSEAIPIAPSGIPAAEATQDDLGRERRDDVSPDVDRRSDELRRLFSDSEKVDVRLEGLGAELFSDDEE